jgi:tRNA1Val (adenine37-N6)-methyltransferase
MRPSPDNGQFLLTCDSLFDGKLVIYQPKRGYRFAIDAVLLAGLTKVLPRDRILDLGTGCGVIPLILAHRNPQVRVSAVEIQPELAELAKHNVEVNGFSERIQIQGRDIRRVVSDFKGERFTLVVSNPPYRRLHTGRVNPDRQQAVARHELEASVADVFHAAGTLLGHGGRLAIIYPATRLAHLLVTAHEVHLTPKRLTPIYSRRASEACLVHLECRKGAGDELRVAPPFLIYDEDRKYTEVMRLLYQERKEGDGKITQSS